MKPRRLAVGIEELVLHGYAPHSGRRVAAAVERELERLFREQGVPDGLTASAHFAQWRGASIKADPGGRPESIGKDVARALYRASERGSKREQ